MYMLHFLLICCTVQSTISATFLFPQDLYISSPLQNTQFDITLTYEIKTAVSVTCSSEDSTLTPKTVQLSVGQTSTIITLDLAGDLPDEPTKFVIKVRCAVPDYTVESLIVITDILFDIDGTSCYSQDDTSGKYLFIKSAFETLGPIMNGKFVTITNHVDLECQVRDVKIEDFSAQVDAISVSVGLSVKKDGDIWIVNSDESTQPGVYSVQCSSNSDASSGSFLFQFIQSETMTFGGVDADITEGEVPCSCDVTAGFCDLHCCCDTADCTEQKLAAFSTCIEGAYGGDMSMRMDRDCYDFTKLSPLDRALCIKKSNSAFLGNHFMLNNDSASSSNKWNGGSAASDIVSKTGPLVRGSLIATKSDSLYKGILSLPGSVGGRCVPAEPLRYLENREVLCSTKVYTKTCSRELNPSSYLTPTFDSGATCHTVYQDGSLTTQATINVVYKISGVIVNDQVGGILTTNDCSYAVVKVLYDVTCNVSAGAIIGVAAEVHLEDLAGREGDDVAIETSVRFITNPGASPKVPRAGYQMYEEIAMVNGTWSMPEYGNCDPDPQVKPKFLVSSVSHCYQPVPATLNCTQVYASLLARYEGFLSPGSLVAAGPTGETNVSVVLTDPLNTTLLTDSEVCDQLPSALHIRVYHASARVTHVQLKLVHGGVVGITEGAAHVVVTVQFLPSDLPKPAVGWTGIVRPLEENLLNTLIVLFCALVYLAFPANVWKL